MVKKFNLKSMVVGGIIGGMLTTGVGYAASQLTSIEVSLNPVNFMYNGVQLELEDGQESYIYDGSTYVPLRWLSESLGKTVEWDEQTRTITIADQVIEEEVAAGEDKQAEENEQKEEDKQEEVSATVAAQLTLDKEKYAATDVLELTILNEGANTLSFGRLFNLEMLKDGEWVEVAANVPVTMELIILGENDSFSQNIDLSLIELQEGTYKLTKHVFDEENESGEEISATFEVTAK